MHFLGRSLDAYQAALEECTESAHCIEGRYRREAHWGGAHGVGRTLEGPVPAQIEAVDKSQPLAPAAHIQVAVREVIIAAVLCILVNIQVTPAQEGVIEYEQLLQEPALYNAEASGQLLSK